MNKIKTVIAVSCLSLLTFSAHARDKPIYYGAALCAYPEYQCIKVQRGQTWNSLFPDETQRDLVQRINRTYNHLWFGKEIAVPVNLESVDMFDLSPFPLQIQSNEPVKQIIVDQDKLAWGAYNEQGRLVKWGPVSSGSDRCSDNSSPTCRTQPGIYRVYSKESKDCKSGVFPLGRGGAKMPYCMYFHKGLALHGSDDIPGYRASHGCIRMFTRDAQWLNLNFVDLSNEGNQYLGTKVIVRPLAEREKKR